MPDEPFRVWRKIGLEGRYNGRQYAADALIRQRNLGFWHRENKAETRILESCYSRNCAFRIRRREWRLMRSITNSIAIASAVVFGIGQAYAGEFDSILRWRNIGPYR